VKSTTIQLSWETLRQDARTIRSPDQPACHGNATTTGGTQRRTDRRGISSTPSGISHWNNRINRCIGMLIAITASHPLCKGRIHLSSLRDQTFIIPQFDENTGFAEHLADLASSGGFEPKAITRVSDFITAITLAAADTAWSPCLVVGCQLMFGILLIREFLGTPVWPNLQWRTVRGVPRSSQSASSDA